MRNDRFKRSWREEDDWGSGRTRRHSRTRYGWRDEDRDQPTGWNDRYRYGRGNQRDRWRGSSGKYWNWRRNDSKSGSPTTHQELSPIEFEKNFYKESDRLAKMDEKEVKDIRDRLDIKMKNCDIKPIVDFDDLEFLPAVHQEFKDRGYKEPTPIQVQSWPVVLSGRDFVGIAQTGSGKTISFVLPGLVHASRQPRLRAGDGPIVLVLSPTRELSLQIKEVFDIYAPYYKMRTLAIYGGVSSVVQKDKLSRGVEVLVATPGRLIDLFDQGCIDLSRVTFLVLDEADRMLDMGFKPQLEKIIPKTNKDRQTLMWSATWPREVRNLAEGYMLNYVQVNISSDALTTNTRIKQVILVMSQGEKQGALIKQLNQIYRDKNFSSDSEKKKVIIFCNMKRTCDEIEYLLLRDGFLSACIHGDKSQSMRDRIISDFKSGRRPILVATDVAARGLDVRDVKCVINYDFPNNCEDYVHRIGRTARGNEQEGVAVAFFTSGDRCNAHDLIKLLVDSRQDVPQELRNIDSDSRGGYARNRFRKW